MPGLKNKSAFASSALFFCSMAFGQGDSTANQIGEMLKQGQPNNAAELSFHESQKNPKNALARILGAQAFFQKGYSNSALLWLKALNAEDWKRVPQGQDRLAEITVLFQKKVPLNLLPGRLEQLSPDSVTGGLRDEVAFAKGRAAFEKKDDAAAKALLETINPRSRYFGNARYLLAAMASRRGDHKQAQAEFSKVFNTGVLDQSTEFWSDVGAQATTHWGTNFKVSLDSMALNESTKVAELSLLGLARSAYGQKDFENALAQYKKVPQTSPLYARAVIEIIWTLLALNRHDEAQKLASSLTVTENSFEALEARTLRALILTDIGQTAEARLELAAFLKAYEETKAALKNFEATRVEGALPSILKGELEGDLRLAGLKKYQQALIAEREEMRKEDVSLFRVFSVVAAQLDPLVYESKNAIDKFIQDHVVRRRADLESLFVQSKLIMAETYLEDREDLREEMKSLTVEDPAKQSEYEKKIVELLESAIASVDEILPSFTGKRARLEFRQAELAWDLSSARGILWQTTKDKKDEALAEALKQRAVKLAQSIVGNHPEFEDHSKAMFFLGYAQTETGSPQIGYKTLELYLKKYPKDKYAPDAYRILADLKFDQNQFREAEAIYRRILEFPESPIVGYALYKIGWCAYNFKDFGRSLLGLEKAVLWATTAADERHLLSLRKESRRDLVSLYAEVGDHKKAFDYFGKFLQGDSTSWIEELAKELDRISQYEKAMDLNKTLIAMEPASVRNLERLASIINGELKLRRWDNVVASTKTMIDGHRAALETPPVDLKAAEKEPPAVAEKVVREAMLLQLFEYRRAPTVEAQERVTRLDGLYLSAFERWDSSQEPLYRHAQFLLAQKKFEDAAKAFRKHWAQFKLSLQEPLREEALRNLIHSLDKSEVPELAAEILERGQEYVTEYPKTKHARSIQFLRSAILLKQQRVEEGIRLSQELFDADASDDLAKGAFKNLRVAYYDLKNWERAYNWASDLAGRDTPAVKMYANEIRAVREETLFLWADQIKEDGASAEIFLKVAADPSMSRLHEKALYNAFVRLERADRNVEALEVADKLEKIAPGSELLTKIAGLRAALYQEAGEYSRAMPLLRTFLAKPDKDAPKESVVQAKLNLALIEESQGHSDAALKGYRDLSSVIEDKKSPKAMEVARGIERLERKAKGEPARPKAWAALEKQGADFRKRPVPKTGDLPTRIRKGAEQLEALAKVYLDLSADEKTPHFYAFEAYCSVPFFYASYVDGVRGIATEDPKASEADKTELKRELEKIVEPVEAKSRVIADQCVQKSWEALHDGPQYRAVLKQWNWMNDADDVKAVEQLITLMGKEAPWLDASSALTEKVILQTHLEKKGTEETWYSLAKLRWTPKNLNLSRLVLVDTLAKYPASGRSLNALTAIEQTSNLDQPSVIALFEKSAESGSKAARANLALLHLKGGRLKKAVESLRAAVDGGLFNEKPEIAVLARRLVK